MRFLILFFCCFTCVPAWASHTAPASAKRIDFCAVSLDPVRDWHQPALRFPYLSTTPKKFIYALNFIAEALANGATQENAAALWREFSRLIMQKDRTFAQTERRSEIENAILFWGDQRFIAITSGPLPKLYFGDRRILLWTRNISPREDWREGNERFFEWTGRNATRDLD